MPLYGLLTGVGQGFIFNQIICDDLATAKAVAGNLDAVEIPADSEIGAGWTYDGTNFIAPTKPETQTTGETNA